MAQKALRFAADLVSGAFTRRLPSPFPPLTGFLSTTPSDSLSVATVKKSLTCFVAIRFGCRPQVVATLICASLSRLEVRLYLCEKRLSITRWNCLPQPFDGGTACEDHNRSVGMKKQREDVD